MKVHENFKFKGQNVLPIFLSTSALIWVQHLNSENVHFLKEDRAASVFVRSSVGIRIQFLTEVLEQGLIHSLIEV